MLLSYRSLETLPKCRTARWTTDTSSFVVPMWDFVVSFPPATRIQTNSNTTLDHEGASRLESETRFGGTRRQRPQHVERQQPPAHGRTALRPYDGRTAPKAVASRRGRRLPQRRLLLRPQHDVARQWPQRSRAVAWCSGGEAVAEGCRGPGEREK